MLSSDSRKAQVKDEDQPRKLAPIMSQAAAWASADQQGISNGEQDLAGYMRSASAEAARDMRASPMPRPPMLYSNSTPNMRDYRMMSAPYPGYPPTSGAMPGYGPSRQYYDASQVAFKYPPMPSPLHPKAGNGVPFPPTMRPGHPSQYAQPPQSPLLPGGAPSAASATNRFPYGSQMLVPPGYAMSGPMAKSIVPIRDVAVSQPAPSPPTTTTPAASPSAENVSPGDQVKSESQPQQQQQQQQRPSPGNSTPIAVRPPASDAAGAVPIAGISASQHAHPQSQVQDHPQPKHQQPESHSQENQPGQEDGNHNGNDVTPSSKSLQAFDELVPVMILRPLGHQFTIDDVIVGRVGQPLQRIVQDFASYSLHYEVERTDPESILAAKETAMVDLRKSLVAQLNHGPAYFGKFPSSMSAGAAGPSTVSHPPASSAPSGNAKPHPMFAMPTPEMYAAMPPYGRVPVQAPAVARPPQPDKERPHDNRDANGRAAAAMTRPRARMWSGQANYPKQEYQPLPSAPADEPEEEVHLSMKAKDQADKSRAEPAGVSIPHKKRTMAQGMRDWKRFAKDSGNGFSSIPALDDIVELMGCGVVSTKAVGTATIEDVADIKRLTASLEKKFAKQLQADDEAEEEELRAAERGRSTRSARAARSSQRRDKGGEAEAEEGEKVKEEQDNSDLWVQCDKCSNWRRLPPKSDPNHPKSLPNRWYCRMNTWDLTRADCSVPQEQYNAHPNARPLSDRARKIRVLVRRLKAMDRFELRPNNRTQYCVERERYYGDVDWIRCANPACGKWRATLRSIDGQAIKDKYPIWYCWMNSWDDARASCGAPQDNSHLRSYAEPVIIEDDQSEEQEAPEPREDEYLDNSQIQGISSKGRIVRSRWNTRRRR